MKEYIVTVNKGVDWREVHNDLINDTTADATVDSSIIPDRECECCNERAINNRNTHYHLSDEEATALRNDPRVMAVTDPTTIPEPTPTATFVGDFNRTSTSSGAQANWGLKLHTSEYNPYQSLTSDPGMGDYKYALDGTGVDMVIVDTGIQVGHPEWEDADGNSRLQQINWFTESGVSGTQPTNFYTDTNGHGTHCIGTMAGKNFGWAKNARIYNITLYSNTGNNITWNNMIDCLIGWHNNKSGANAGRPTVVNMSFQYSWFLRTNVTPNQVVLSSTGYDVTGGNHRGVAHTETVRSNLTQYGVVGSSRPDIGAGYYLFGRKYASIDADVEQLINNGIHVCTAAGNNYMKIDHPGGTDYNNYLTFNLGGTTYYQYYHRGKSPSTFEGGDTFNTTNTGVSTGDINEGFEVGAIDSADTSQGSLVSWSRKANFSDTGPAVEIYTVGRQVISAQPNNQGLTYFADSAWRQAKYSGTSMAAPQMCGMMACLLQAHPDWTPAQVKNWVIANAKEDLHTTSLTNDYTDTDSVMGGTNRRAYFPLHGDTVFEHRERVADSKIFDIYFYHNGNEYRLTGSDRNGVIGENIAQPTLAFNNGDIVRFWVHSTTSALHPLYIKTTQSTGTGNQVTGVSTQGGATVWETAIDGAGSYGYQCSNHLSMWNTITVT